MDYENFTDVEIACQHCGQRNPDLQIENRTMCQIQNIRRRLVEPMPITSGYRCDKHPIERHKTIAGEHNRAAVDIGSDSVKSFRILNEAVALPYLQLVDRLLSEISYFGVITEESLNRQLVDFGWDGDRLEPIFTGIGVSQKSGSKKFIHLDTRTTTPVLWSY